MKKSCHQPCKLAQILHHFLKANPKNTPPPGDFFKTAAMWEGVKFFRPPLYPRSSSTVVSHGEEIAENLFHKKVRINSKIKTTRRAMVSIHTLVKSLLNSFLLSCKCS